MNTKLNNIYKLIKKERYDEALHKTILLERMVGQDPAILMLKASLIQQTSDDNQLGLKDAEKCYRKVMENYPYNMGAYIELYNFYNNVMNDEAKAIEIKDMAEEVLDEIKSLFN